MGRALRLRSSHPRNPDTDIVAGTSAGPAKPALPTGTGPRRGSREPSQLMMRRAPTYPDMSTLPTSTGLPNVVACTILPLPM